jgi:hypothetical protein
LTTAGFDLTPLLDGWDGKLSEIIDPIDWLAHSKGTTGDAFRAFGAITGKNGAIKFPAWGPDGERCSGFWIRNPADKGQNFKGQPAGLFWPNCRAKPGEKWFMVEGVKDAAAMWQLGYQNTVGLNTNFLAAKFCHLFESVDLTIIPDRDQPSESGAKQTARILAGHARTVRIATLPGILAESHGEDVRDILRRSGGEEQIRRAIQLARLVDEKGEPRREIEFKLLSGPELNAANVKLEPIIDYVLYANQPCVIGGPSKSLKTSLLVDLAVSVSCTRKFLDHFWVPEKKRIALMSGESGMAALQNCYRRVCRSKGLDPAADAQTMFLSDSLPRLDQTDHIDAIGRLVDSYGLQLLLLDPFYLAAGEANSSSLNEMGILLRRIGEICVEANCTLVIAHHTIKRPGLLQNRGGGEPLEREDLHGSGIGEWCRQWILLNRRLPYEPGIHEMNLVIGGSAGHSGHWALTVNEGEFSPEKHGGLEKWKTQLTPLEEARALDEEIRSQKKDKQKAEKEATATENTARRIVDFLSQTEFHLGATERQIQKKLHIGTATCTRALEFAHDAGWLNPASIYMVTIAQYNTPLWGLRSNSQYQRSDPPSQWGATLRRYTRSGYSLIGNTQSVAS